MLVKDINIRAYDECIKIYGQDFVDKYHAMVFEEVSFRIKHLPKQLIGTTKDEIAHRENILYHGSMSQMHRCETRDNMCKAQIVKINKGLESQLNFSNLD